MDKDMQYHIFVNTILKYFTQKIVSVTITNVAIYEVLKYCPLFYEVLKYRTLFSYIYICNKSLCFGCSMNALSSGVRSHLCNRSKRKNRMEKYMIWHGDLTGCILKIKVINAPNKFAAYMGHRLSFNSRILNSKMVNIVIDYIKFKGKL